MATHEEVDARVLNKVGNNSTFWTPDERRESLNESLSVWQAMTGEWSGKITMQPSGETIQDVPRQIISPQRVSYNGTMLTEVSLEELDLGTPNWQARTSQVTNGSMEDWLPGIDTTGLLSWWDLEEASGTRADSFGSNSLTETGGTTPGVPGRCGKGAEFIHGSGKWLEINTPSSAVELSGDFAISAWVYLYTNPDSTTRYSVIDRARNYSIEVLDSDVFSGSFTFYYSDSGNTARHVIATTFSTPPTNQWIHIYADYTSATLTSRICINNGTTQTATHPLGPDTSVSGDMRIGDRGASRTWDGRIDQVSLWARTLTDDERTILYNEGLGRALQPTPLHWGSFGTSPAQDAVAEDPDRVEGDSSARLAKYSTGYFGGGIHKDITVTPSSKVIIKFWAKGPPIFFRKNLRFRYESLAQTVIRDFADLPTDWTQFEILIPTMTETSATISWQASVSDSEPESRMFIDKIEVYANQTPTMWAPVGFNKMVVYPVPTSGTITVEGLIDPPYMPFWPVDIGEDKLEVLVGYAHHIMSFKEAGSEFQSTMPLMGRMISEATKRNRELRASAMYRKYIGEIRDDRERPRGIGDETLGARS